MQIVCTALELYVIAIFARIILSWFPISGDGAMATIAGFLYMITDPVLGPLRRALPPLRLGSVSLDLSPIVAIIGIQVLAGVIC